MSTTDAPAASPGLGWWPTLVLWVLVILFGVLYLGSVNRHMGKSGEAGEPVSATRVPTVPVSDSAARMQQGPPQAEVRAASTEPAAATPVDPTMHAVEAAAFASSLMSAPPEREDPAQSVAAPPAPETRSTLDLPGTGGVPAAEQGPIRASTDPLAGEAVALSSTTTPAAALDAVPTGTGSAAVPAESPAVDRPHDTSEARAISRGADSGPPVPGQGGGESMETRRQRVLAEYEAMRRAAQPQLRRWGGPQMPAPAGALPASPGYGYGPRAYPPPR